MSNLSIVDDGFNDERVKLIRQTYADGASPLEFELFISNCKKFGLSPEAGQIHCVGRVNKKLGRKVFTTQPSLQGLRTVANRTGEYLGQKMPEYLDSNTGLWTDHWINDYPPAAARVGIYRKGFIEPVAIPLRFESYANRYNGQLTNMWATMPEHMIQKCATAASLRAAFPDLCSGLFIEEESHVLQTDTPILIEPDDDRLEKMILSFNDLGVDVPELEKLIKKSIRECNDDDFEILKNEFSLRRKTAKVENVSTDISTQKKPNQGLLDRLKN